MTVSSALVSRLAGAPCAGQHGNIEEAKAAGVYVFGGGIYPGSILRGGFKVLELPTQEDAVEWARKIAVACRCSQELGEFMYEPQS